MVMSDFPLRKLSVPWRRDEYDSGRVVITTSYVNALPLLGGTVYGVAKSPSHADPLALTERILQTCTEELVDGASGPRYIQGDFNIDVFELPQTRCWYDKGWRELQLVAQELWLQPIQPTSKMVAIVTMFGLVRNYWLFYSQLKYSIM